MEKARVAFKVKAFGWLGSLKSYRVAEINFNIETRESAEDLRSKIVGRARGH